MQAMQGQYILLSERVQREPDGVYSAFCDELGLATCGDTADLAKTRLRSAARNVLNFSTKKGSVLEYLASRNIRLYQLPSHIGTWPGYSQDPWFGAALSVGDDMIHRPAL